MGLRKKINPREIQKSYMDRMENDLEKQGLTFFQPDINLDIDSDFLSLPREITEVTSKDLGEYLNAFTQQKMYYRTLYGRATLLVEEAQRVYYEVSAREYEIRSREKLSETAKERIINSKPEIRPYYEALRDCTRKQEIISQAILNIEDAIFMISREVSRRNSDYDSENRNHNVGRM